MDYREQFKQICKYTIKQAEEQKSPLFDFNLFSKGITKARKNMSTWQRYGLVVPAKSTKKSKISKVEETDIGFILTPTGLQTEEFKEVSNGETLDFSYLKLEYLTNKRYIQEQSSILRDEFRKLCKMVDKSYEGEVYFSSSVSLRTRPFYIFNKKTKFIFVRDQPYFKSTKSGENVILLPDVDKTSFPYFRYYSPIMPQGIEHLDIIVESTKALERRYLRDVYF